MTTTPMRLSWAELDALATGEESAATVAILGAGKLNKNLLMLRVIVDDARRDHPDAYTAAGIEANYDLLAAIEESDPDTVTAVLAHPQVGSWLGDCMRQVLTGTEQDGRPLRVMLGYLGAVAAAAAIRAGHHCQVAVPIQQGTVMLPTLGLARLAGNTWSGTAVVRCRREGVTIRGGDAEVAVPADPRADAPGWDGLRQLSVYAEGRRLTVDLDDLSVLDGIGETVAGRLPAETVTAWQRVLEDAWTLLVRHHPRHAAMTAATLASISPLQRATSRSGVSMTMHDAFGAVFLTPPEDGASFAGTLVHELFHSRLTALMDLVSLHTDCPGELFYSPWRGDPRPLAGILHGSYAFLAVADFLRCQRTLAGDRDAPLAHFEFACRRDQVDAALRTLLTARNLTDHGLRFVRAMAAKVASWQNQAVAPVPAALARQEVIDHRLRWRLINMRPEHRQVVAAARAWPRGRPSPVEFDAVAAEVLPATRELKGERGRALLRRLRLEDPDRFGRIVAGTEAVPAEATDADVALARGDHADAIRRYTSLIADGPEHVEPWAGLAIACHQIPEDNACRALAARPEIVRAVHREIRVATAAEPDPLELAGWLAAPALGSGSLAGPSPVAGHRG